MEKQGNWGEERQRGGEVEVGEEAEVSSRIEKAIIEIERNFTIRNAIYPGKNSAVYLVSCPFVPSV